jgi:hypothetical protein
MTTNPTSPTNPTDMTVHVLWINAGLSCDGDRCR